MAVRDVSVLKDKETGDISVLHDKNLQDAKAKTTPDNTDAVRMVDVNGKEVYIQRDSFAAAVFSVINSNNKDSVAGLFGVDASGGFGKITASNLASVLSAIILKARTFSGNCNDLRSEVVYVYGATNSPGDFMFVIALGVGDGDKGQLAFGNQNIKVRTSDGNTWSSWKTIS